MASDNVTPIRPPEPRARGSAIRGAGQERDTGAEADAGPVGPDRAAVARVRFGEAMVSTISGSDTRRTACGSWQCRAALLTGPRRDLYSVSAAP